MNRSAPDEADVHAKAAVDARALQAHEYAIRYGGPLRILRIAVRARLGHDREERKGDSRGLSSVRSEYIVASEVISYLGGANSKRRDGSFAVVPERRARTTHDAIRTRM